jgi:hypothetical protein
LGDARPVTHLPPERHAFLQEGGAARQVALVECQAPYRPEGLRLQVRSASAALAKKRFNQWPLRSSSHGYARTTGFTGRLQNWPIYC